MFDAWAASMRALVDGHSAATRGVGVPQVADSEGGMFGVFFAGRPPQNDGGVIPTERGSINRFFHSMLGRGARRSRHRSDCSIAREALRSA